MNHLKRFIYNNIIPFVGKLYLVKNEFVNVIYYHDIVKDEGHSFMRTNVDLFKSQMQYIAANNYKTLRFDELDNDNNLKFEKKKVIIAFDDGWISNYTEIYEFMKSLGLKYNIYLTVGEIGKNADYLNWDIVRKMHGEGVVGFGVHTFSHPDMSNITNIDTEIEFLKADVIFEENLGYKPLDFCYPYGCYSEESNDYIVNHTDYSRIYTSRLMYSYSQNGKIVFGRNGISNDETFSVFKAKLNGCFNVWRTIIG